MQMSVCCKVYGHDKYMRNTFVHTRVHTLSLYALMFPVNITLSVCHTHNVVPAVPYNIKKNTHSTRTCIPLKEGTASVSSKIQGNPFVIFIFVCMHPKARN